MTSAISGDLIKCGQGVGSDGPCGRPQDSFFLLCSALGQLRVFQYI